METINYEDFKAEWLKGIADKKLTPLEKGRSFAKKLIADWLDLEELEADDYFHLDGSGDGGVDIAYLHRGSLASDIDEEAGDVWYIIQSKYGTSFQGTGTLLLEGQKAIDSIRGNNTRLSRQSSDFVEGIKNFMAKSSEKDKIVLLYATTDPLSSEEKETLKSVKAIGRDALPLQFEVEHISIHTIYSRNLSPEDACDPKKVKINASLVESGDGLLVGSVGLLELYEFMKAYKSVSNDLDLLYEKNVRRYLGRRGAVNKGIEKTLNDEPDRFGLYNNGVTVVVEAYRKIDANHYELEEPYIVNGCQTTKTIWDTLHKKLDSGGTGTDEEIEAWKKRLQKGISILKIVITGKDGEEVLEKTTRFTNSQNAVKRQDFFALEDDFKRWKRTMAENYHFFLEIQRGGWESYIAQIKRDPHAREVLKKHGNALDLLKIYGAGWLKKPGTAFGKNPPFTPGGTLFKEIVADGAFNEEDLFACHLVSEVIGENFGRKAEQESR